MATSWTKIAKASGTTFTKVAKPSLTMADTFTGGDPIGLLLALTYSTVTQAQDTWTNITKASGTSWTKISKAT